MSPAPSASAPASPERGVRRRSQTRFGASVGEGATTFRLWAPEQKVRLELEGIGELPMQPGADGLHEISTPQAGPGSLYRFVIGDGLRVPDPCSRFQPQDVHGPSEVIDPAAYVWRDGGWRGRPWEEAVVYELHVGAFTEEGTFRAAIARLDALVELGVTAIELMPVADFPGRRNWGYDGVLLFAPDSSYGRPKDLKSLIDAAHARGLMVFLDVVYNHFGPDGNYLAGYAPLFNQAHETPWGAAVNYDAEGSSIVRELIVENALYWLQEYHLDGLRLDAVHAIRDDSSEHILDALAQSVRDTIADRHVHLILENEENQSFRLARRADGTPRSFTAQWNDDVHHVLHCAATGERSGYYAEYAGNTELLGRALAEGFAFQGEMMSYRGEPRGEPSAGLPPTAFVSFIQNHDQVGNRAFGDRLSDSVAAPKLRALAAIYLLAPQIPMLFMGEEWAAAQPFPFFCDFAGELADAVREGRRNEFASFPEFQDPVQRARIPDPTAEATFRAAKLDWDAADQGPHRDQRALYRALLRLRHAEIVPRLSGMGGHTGDYEVLGPGAVGVRWRLGDGARLVLLANLGEDTVALAASPGGRRLWAEGEPCKGSLPPWCVLWTLEDSSQ